MLMLLFNEISLLLCVFPISGLKVKGAFFGVLEPRFFINCDELYTYSYREIRSFRSVLDK